MRIIPVKSNYQKPAFNGYTVEGIYGRFNSHLDVAKKSRPRYEKTLGSFHPEYTAKLYYADPLEKVSDSIRESVDYVFYDDEPRFPDINNEASKLYFFPADRNKKWDFVDKLKAVREYFYRLEMADSKTVGEYVRKVWNNIDKENSQRLADYFKAHVIDAKYNQETVAVCENIFNEAEEMIDKKDDIYSEIRSLNGNLEERKADVIKAAKELEQRKQLGSILQTKINTLRAKQAGYENLSKTLLSSQTNNEAGIEFTKQALEYNKNHLPYNNWGNKDFLAGPIAFDSYKNINAELSEDKNYDENEKAQIVSSLKKIQADIKKYTKELESNNLYLEKIRNYIEELPQIIKNIEKDIVVKNGMFEQAKADLIPHFDKLKNYFYSRGIRVIK